VATTVMADGTGCNYDGTTLAWPTTADGSFDIWTNGEHSKKSTSMRKIRGFVSGAKDKASGNSPSTKDVAYKDNKFIAIMNKYWKSKSLDEHTWGEQMIKAAFEGTKVGTNTHLDFSTVGRDFRKEAIQKGIVYTNIFPYVIWEMQDAVNDCLMLGPTMTISLCTHGMRPLLSTQDRRPAAKGTAYLSLTLVNCSTGLRTRGVLTSRRAQMDFLELRKVNQDIFALFNLGKEEARKSATSASTADCAQLNTLKEKISHLVLSSLRSGYLFVTSTRRGTMIPAGARNKVGELWAFRDCDPTLRGRSRRKRC
jgi:hypothetical protein